MPQGEAQQFFEGTKARWAEWAENLRKIDASGLKEVLVKIKSLHKPGGKGWFVTGLAVSRRCTQWLPLHDTASLPHHMAVIDTRLFAQALRVFVSVRVFVLNSSLSPVYLWFRALSFPQWFLTLCLLRSILLARLQVPWTRSSNAAEHIDLILGKLLVGPLCQQHMVLQDQGDGDAPRGGSHHQCRVHSHPPCLASGRWARPGTHPPAGVTINSKMSSTRIMSNTLMCFHWQSVGRVFRSTL